MPPRFDAERLTLRLGIADLLEGPLARHLGFAQRGGFERLWLGQAIHSRYQEQAVAADPSYRREVPLAVTLPHRGWQVTIEGRADGLRREADGTWVVEEIKSIRRGSPPSPLTRDLYRRQALLYSWLLHRQGHRPVRAELLLIEIGGDGIEREPLAADPAALEAGVRRRLNQLLRGFETERAAAEARRLAAATLPFPYPQARPGQESILAAVERAVNQREHLLLEAATGIGKTVAALVPAVRYALAHEKRVFVLTAKTLQQEMATAVLDLLNRRPAFNGLQLRAKAKMCANHQLICHEEYCAFARDYYLKVQKTGIVPALLAERGTLRPERIYATASGVETCPFEVSLELAGRAQVVVGDYNYAFAPYVALSDFGPDADLSDTILLIDEAHNLVDRSRGYFSPQLSAAAARAAAEACERGGHPVPRRVAALARDLTALVERAVGSALELAPAGAAEAEARLPEEDLFALRPDFDAAFVDYLEHQREARSFREHDPFVDLYFSFLRFLETLSLATGATSAGGRGPGAEAFSCCVDRAGAEARLRILCKDASRFLAGVIDRVHAAVALSATLSPPEFYRDLLGFDAARTSVLSVPNPFPPEHRRVVIDPTVATAWRERQANYDRIAERLGRFAGAIPGNCLALFPSYEFLDQVARRLAPAAKRVLVQGRGDSDADRAALLDTLRHALFGDVLLLAVAGGVFAEGVDYPGDMLRAVAVVGPCLPSVSLERALLRDYFDDRFERGFEYAFVVPGMTRVVQAAGRLIRSPQDTGVIALFDRRFLSAPYRDYLPAEWVPEGGPGELCDEPHRAAVKFFDRLAGPGREAPPEVPGERPVPPG